MWERGEGVSVCVCMCVLGARFPHSVITPEACWRGNEKTGWGRGRAGRQRPICSNHSLAAHRSARLSYFLSACIRASIHRTFRDARCLQLSRIVFAPLPHTSVVSVRSRRCFTFLFSALTVNHASLRCTRHTRSVHRTHIHTLCALNQPTFFKWSTCDSLMWLIGSDLSFSDSFILRFFRGLKRWKYQ